MFCSFFPDTSCLPFCAPNKPGDPINISKCGNIFRDVSLYGLTVKTPAKRNQPKFPFSIKCLQ